MVEGEKIFGKTWKEVYSSGDENEIKEIQTKTKYPRKVK